MFGSHSWYSTKLLHMREVRAGQAQIPISEDLIWAPGVYLVLFTMTLMCTKCYAMINTLEKKITDCVTNWHQNKWTSWHLSLCHFFMCKMGTKLFLHFLWEWWMSILEYSWSTLYFSVNITRKKEGNKFVCRLGLDECSLSKRWDYTMKMRAK